MPPISSFNVPSYIQANHRESQSDNANNANTETQTKAKRKRKQSPKRRKKRAKKLKQQQIPIEDAPFIPIQSTETIDTDSLPLGHPKRISFKDTMSEAFHHKYKNQKRTVSHRRWARPKKCRDCNITYPSTDDYELHRMVHHSEGIQIDHLCPICKSKYNERRWLNRLVVYVSILLSVVCAK